MSDARSREAIPDEYRWSLTSLFDSETDWEAVCERYADDVASLSFDEALTDNPDTLLDALERRDSLRERGSELLVYAECRVFEDVTSETAQARVRRVESLNADRDATLQDLADVLRTTGRDRVTSLLADDDRLAHYQHYVDDVFRRGAYALESAAENALGALTESLDAPARTLRTLADSEFDVPTVAGPDGEDVRLTRARRNDALTHPDRTYRRRVYEAYRNALQEHRQVSAQAYIDHLQRHATEADLRGYESPAAASLDGLVSESARQTLTEGIREHRAAFCRPYEYRCERAGVDELRPWDLRAPLSNTDPPDVPYERAVDAVLEAVAPLGDDYQRRLAAFLDGSHVDVYPYEHKRGIPAVMFGRDGTDAFVHLNYEETLESLFLFAHELGHVMHYELARETQPAAYRRLSWYAGELPSFLHELLLARHLLGADWLPDGAVLDTVVGRLTPLPPARGAAFTHRVVEDVRGDGSVTADDIDAHFRVTGEAFFDHVTFTAEDGHRWLALNLDRDPFHAYYYALGRTSALAASGRLREGSLSPERYCEFLRAGDSDYPLTLLSSLGLDLESDAVVETASAEYERLVDELA